MKKKKAHHHIRKKAAVPNKKVKSGPENKDAVQKSGKTDTAEKKKVKPKFDLLGMFKKRPQVKDANKEPKKIEVKPPVKKERKKHKLNFYIFRGL